MLIILFEHFFISPTYKFSLEMSYNLVVEDLHIHYKIRCSRNGFFACTSKGGDKVGVHDSREQGQRLADMSLVN